MQIDPKFQFYFGVWTSILLGFATGAVHLPSTFSQQEAADITSWTATLTWINTVILTAMSGYSSNKSGPLVSMPAKALVMLALIPPVLLASLLPARAGDIAAPAPSLTAINKAIAAGYPTKCGGYYGIGTGGNAGAVNGAAVGTQIVQGDIDVLFGYTCPFAQNAVWFVEGQGGLSNLNGSSNGFALSGPAVFIERAGVGSPIQALLGSVLPNLNFPAVPSAPSFPTGVTPSTAPQSYGFAGLVEQDIGAQIGAISGHQWVVAPIIGAGLLTRYSNQMVVDTWAGWQMNSNSFCPRGGTTCGKLGNMARVGVSLKY